MTTCRELLALLADAATRNVLRTDCYAVSALPTPNLGWIGCGNLAHAAFLLRVAPGGPRPHGMLLPAVRVRHGVHVRIDDGYGQQEVEVSVIECSASDRPMIELFVRCIGSVVAERPGPLSGAAVSDAMDRLLELFRAVAHATDGEILGLWAELALIAYSRDAAAMVGCWRLRETSSYDFGTAVERLDVKATTKSLRHHELSFEQSQPPPGATAAFASIMTERVASGVTVGQLWERILERAPALQHKVDSICVTTLGRDWQLAREHAFDLQRALTSLRVYPSVGVPRILALPQGVLRARFVSDFERGTPWHGSFPSPSGPIATAVECGSRHAGAVS